jgi:hypothetical protein
MKSSVAVVAGGNFTGGGALTAGAVGNAPGVEPIDSVPGSIGPVGGLALTLFGSGSGDLVGRSPGVGRAVIGGSDTGGGAVKVGAGRD